VSHHWRLGLLLLLLQLLLLHHTTHSSSHHRLLLLLLQGVHWLGPRHQRCIGAGLLLLLLLLLQPGVLLLLLLLRPGVIQLLVLLVQLCWQTLDGEDLWLSSVWALAVKQQRPPPLARDAAGRPDCRRDVDVDEFSTALNAAIDHLAPLAVQPNPGLVVEVLIQRQDMLQEAAWWRRRGGVWQHSQGVRASTLEKCLQAPAAQQQQQQHECLTFGAVMLTIAKPRLVLAPMGPSQGQYKKSKVPLDSSPSTC
jgi:hypothetical protein